MAYKLRTGATREIEIEFSGETTTFKVRPQTTGETSNLVTAVQKAGKQWNIEKSLPHILPLIVEWNIEDEYGKPAEINLRNLSDLPTGIIDALTAELRDAGFLGVRPKTAE